MRYLVKNIEWDAASAGPEGSNGQRPTLAYVELAFDPLDHSFEPDGDTHPVEDAVRNVLDIKDALLSWEIVRSPTMQDFTDMLADGLKHGDLECDAKTMMHLMFSAHFAYANGALDNLYKAVDRLIGRGNDIALLYPDGPIEGHSFGFSWYSAKLRIEGLSYVEKVGEKPWCHGGMIFRGPETNPNYTTREWSVHT